MSTKILSNVVVTKRKELSKSYGSVETVAYSYLKEYDNEIQVFNAEGNWVRTFRKGTKLLIKFEGKEISKKTFDLRTKKAIAEFEARMAKREAEFKAELAAKKEAVDKNKKILKDYFISNPEFKQKIQNRINNFSSKDWRNWVRMKVCKAIYDEKFVNCNLSASDIRDVAFED